MPTVNQELLAKLRDYRMPAAAQDLLKAHPPLIIAGITAAGKDSAVQYIVKISDYRPVITHTTRPARTGETNGRDYYFVSEEDMLNLLNSQAVIEAQVVHGEAVYGSSIRAYQDVISGNYRPLLNMDIQGVEAITKYLPQLKAVFLLPPSYEVWMRWLEERSHMSHVERLGRLQSARSELAKALDSKIFYFVVNQEIAGTANQILHGMHDLSTQSHNRDLARQLLAAI